MLYHNRPFFQYFIYREENSIIFLNGGMVWVNVRRRRLHLVNSWYFLVILMTTCFAYFPFSISDENYENIRIYTVLSVCLLRFLLTRRSLQVYLNMAFERVKKLKKESGRITNIDLQKRVSLI